MSVWQWRATAQSCIHLWLDELYVASVSEVGNDVAAGARVHVAWIVSSRAWFVSRVARQVLKTLLAR